MKFIKVTRAQAYDNIEEYINVEQIQRIQYFISNCAVRIYLVDGKVLDNISCSSFNDILKQFKDDGML
jgi:hypothetical protein